MGKIKICPHDITPKSNCRKCRQLASREHMRKLRLARKQKADKQND